MKPVRPWHSLPADEVVAALAGDPQDGLTSVEAIRRLAEVGPNVLGEDGGPGRLSILVHQFTDVMIWILIVAALVSGLLLDEWIDAGVILAIVVLNAVLGFVQESRAENALARLKEMAAPEAVVVRDGGERRVPTAEVVPGDVLVLEAGDRVAADARLIHAVRLEAEESALTGESFPSAKQVAPVEEGVSLGDRRSMLFSGTSVATGRGRAMVTSTGGATEVGRLAEVLTQEEAPPPLKIELARVGRRLAVICLVAAGLIFLTGLLRGKPAEAMFLTSVALAVAAIPEGLPAVVTITLSGGVQRMAARNAIVRRLAAVESLGAATVICTDKTGTLTRNEIRVQQVVLDGLHGSPAELPADDRRVRRFIDVSALCNDSRDAAGGGYLGDPTEVALLMAVSDLGADAHQIRHLYPRVDEFAFDSRRKRMTTIHEVPGGLLAAVKGAPEVLVGRCRAVEGADGPVPFDEARRVAVLEAAAGLARGGLRTLALAYREAAELPSEDDEVESELVLISVVGMSDAVRAEAAPAVAEAQRAGITVVMVTGDHEVTARAVAGEVGILGPDDEVLPGERLRDMTAEELAADVERYRVYSRIDPLDKVKIVEAWQQRGEIVAMTGDGVNDAPALHAADIGVAMGSGTDVAKDASDMVLTDDNFASIVSAVREGRGIFANLKTVVYFLLSCNLSEVLVMFLGFLVFGALGDPLLAVQLLWVNLVTDGLPALALGMDPPAPNVMLGPPDRSRDILSLRQQLVLLRFGTLLTVASLGALVIGHYALGYEWVVVRTTVFVTLVLTQLAHAYVTRSRLTGKWGKGPGRNRLLILGLAGSLGLQVAVVYAPIGQTLFDTAALPAVAWGLVLGLTAFSFVAANMLNLLAARRRAHLTRPA